ncbi:hydroxyacid dehydrogenase [Microbacterium sp. ZW T2_14]|uniref:hydroxyacid dehydrogenase n=1 Tax=Microbacterium sp. ZW T2_14 TaxID=3378079 RepID=UPI0038518767
MRAALLMDPALVPFVFDADAQARLRALVRVEQDAVTSVAGIRDPSGVELLIAGWGATIGAGDLDALPALRGIVHWSGGNGALDGPAQARGIRISTAKAANAIPVAEFTLAMITLAAKDAFWASRLYTSEQRFIDREAELPDTGLYGTTVGIVGASTIGRLVVQKLRDIDVHVLVYDPYATAADAEALGAELVDDLAALAARADVLSIHAPEMPSTLGMISAEVLAALPDGATVINTARGGLMDQDALVEQLQRGRLRAILDVTEPDPLPTGHPLYDLPNAFLTPHLAGSMGNELRRLGEVALAEVERFVAGAPFAHPAP